MPAYIYCKAYGGINDALNQLFVCTEYAKKHGRTIILQFMDYNTNLTDVFDFSQYPVPITTDLSLLEGCKIEPESYRPYLHVKPYALESQLQFNKNLTYPADVIPIHASCGGGMRSILALEHLRFTDSFIASYNALYGSMPSVYFAIHVRNTDSPTDVKKHEAEIRQFAMNKPVYICSDNKHTVEWAAQFGISGTKTRFYGDEPLHTSLRAIDSSVLFDTIYDLLIMAKSTRLLTIKPDRMNMSGFAFLANALKGRPALIKTLLQG